MSGFTVGVSVGVPDGPSVGSTDGEKVGASDGTAVGTAVRCWSAGGTVGVPGA